MSRKRIVRRSLSERRPGGTDWPEVRGRSDSEIERAAAEDDDNALWTEDELRRARMAMPSGEPKVPVSIRLDREIVDYFKSQGPGYQSRISAVLLSYVRRQNDRL